MKMLCCTSEGRVGRMYFLHFFNILVGFLNFSLTCCTILLKCDKKSNYVERGWKCKSFHKTITGHWRSGVLPCCLLAGQLRVVAFFWRVSTVSFSFHFHFLRFFQTHTFHCIYQNFLFHLLFSCICLLPGLLCLACGICYVGFLWI